MQHKQKKARVKCCRREQGDRERQTDKNTQAGKQQKLNRQDQTGETIQEQRSDGHTNLLDMTPICGRQEQLLQLTEVKK